jgi:hypothetical protein
VILETEADLAVAVVSAIHTGDTARLRQLLAEHPELATARLGDPDHGMSRTLLHVATDWPGHFPRVAETIAALVEAGAEVNARFTGPHTETPLHWAASSDDLEALDALLDAGAEIDAQGAVIAGGTPLDDARAFGQWQAAYRLVERGAAVGPDSAATLGLMDRLTAQYASEPGLSATDTSRLFWQACHGGQPAAAEYLLARGADPNWVPDWEPLTPLDAARRNGNRALVEWLTGIGAVSSAHP